MSSSTYLKNTCSKYCSLLKELYLTVTLFFGCENRRFYSVSELIFLTG
jgi:hypothetical protein